MLSLLHRCIATLIFLLAAPAHAWSNEACHLNLGWSRWEPFHYIAADGRMTGIDHALMTEATRRMDCSLSWKELPRARALVALREGQIDGLAGLTRTAGREAFGLFSDTFRTGRNVLVVRKGEAARWRFSSLRELAASNFRLGTQQGASFSQEYEELVDSGTLGNRLVPLTTGESALMMLVHGRIDGYIDGRIVHWRRARTMKVADQVEEHSLAIDSHQAHVLFSRRTVKPELVARFNAALATMAADATIERLMNADYPQSAPFP